MTERRRWTEVFHRSSISPVVFVVAADCEEEVWELVCGLGLPEAFWSDMFSPAYWSYPLLDGVVMRNSNYGFPAMMLPDAVRVVGFAPMRLLCELMALAPPRRLKWEANVLPGDELRRRLDAQRALPAEDLEKQARLGCAGDRMGLLQTVHDLFGDQGQPPLSEDDRLALRAEDEWGDLGGFVSVGLRDQLKALGLTTSEIRRWQRLGFLERLWRLDDEVKRLHELSPSDVERLMNNEGFDGWTAVQMLERGMSVNAMREYKELGGEGTFVVAGFEDSGLGIDGLRAFLTHGWDPSAATYWAQEGIAVDEAESWVQLGFSPWEAGRVRSYGGTLERARELCESGMTPDEIRQHFFRHPEHAKEPATSTDPTLDLVFDSDETGA